jgi:predicted Zn-dependent protease
MKLFFRSIFILLLFISSSHAESIVRDAEIETVLRSITDPIFKAANLDPKSIDVYIINNHEINAYVAGGNNIFINTGLLGMFDNPNVITGVLAHETGHISGGHLLKNMDESKNTAFKTTLGYMIGLAAAAAGSPQAGMAIASGAGQVAHRQMLKYTRSHEESADQAALNYLDRLHQSAKGLLELLQVLYGKETTLYGSLNPYTTTHPLSKERIEHVNDHLKKSPYSNTEPSADKVAAFGLAVTKLNAFLDPYEKTLKKYPESDNSLNAHYARSIAYYKIPKLDKSLAEINKLIELQPQNPFFHEMKGQILFENGKVMESIPYYTKAVDLMPSSALLRIVLATAQISSENESMRTKAIANLEKALVKEKNNAFAWNQLGIAYGRGNDLGMSNIALAEEAAVTGRKNDVKKFLAIAKQYVKPGSPAELKMKDLQSAIDEEQK